MTAADRYDAAKRLEDDFAARIPLAAGYHLASLALERRQPCRVTRDLAAHNEGRLGGLLFAYDEARDASTIAFAAMISETR